MKGLSLLMPDSLYIYGEVLQDRNVNEVGYAEYIDQTASAYGHALREALRKGAAPDRLLTDWEHPVSPDRLVTWVESHDTYCNQHESADMTDGQMRAGYVFLTARQHGRPLFFSRPMGSTRENYWGNNRIGARGNDEFKHPEVAAANRFRRAMHGRAERLVSAADGRVVEICRGADGAALVNFSDRDLKVKMPTDLPDGTYRDAVSGRDFKVAKGELSGRLAPLGTYILYR